LRDRPISERLVDAIREGKAPEVVRRNGAQGNLPLPLQESIEVLTVLARDRVEEIRQTAFDTLTRWDSGELQEVLSNPSTPPAVLDFATSFLARGREVLLDALLQNPNLPDDLRDEIESRLLEEARQKAAPAVPLPPGSGQAGPPSGLGEGVAGRETLIQKINRLSAVEKIKQALTGNLETRMILVHDSNKLVARAVLQSPKLTTAEIEGYASAKNISEEILRLIAVNRAFMKSYTIARALLNNPRAPIDITLPLLNRMNDNDMKALTMNRNIPEVIRNMAIRTVKQKEAAKNPKLLPGKH
jgi:hypothetical protein